jgi:hypothetical protein
MEMQNVTRIFILRDNKKGADCKKREKSRYALIESHAKKKQFPNKRSIYFSLEQSRLAKH